MNYSDYIYYLLFIWWILLDGWYLTQPHALFHEGYFCAYQSHFQESFNGGYVGFMKQNKFRDVCMISGY